MSADLDDRLTALHALIRSGSLREARAGIRALCEKKSRRRKDTLRLAYLARLTGMHEQALRLLHRVVRGASKGHPPSEEERAEYGTALAYFGAGREAIEVLGTVDVTEYPWAFHGLMLAYFRQWDWSLALPPIREFQGRSGVSESDRLLASYYLGRALLHGDGESREAEALLVRLAGDTARLGYGSLHQDTLLALADCHYLSRDWKRACAVLDRLDLALQGTQEALQALSSRQLRVETRLQSSGGRDRAALAELRRVRAQWVAMRRWERVRGCDYQQALATRDEKLLTHLYFGTAYPAARAKFLREFGWSVDQLPSYYDWSLRKEKKGTRLDATSGLFGATDRLKAALKPGQLALRTIGALAQDFYFPPTVATLHERIHPGEVLHPVAGPARVRQALKTAREALLQARIPLRIGEQRGRYELTAQRGLEIRVPHPGVDACFPERTRLLGWLDRARRAFGERGFSSAELARKECVSERTARRFLKEALEEGLVQVSGADGVCYRIS